LFMATRSQGMAFAANINDGSGAVIFDQDFARQRAGSLERRAGYFFYFIP
jgi:hypothetical protein